MLLQHVRHSEYNRNVRIRQIIVRVRVGAELAVLTYSEAAALTALVKRILYLV